MTAPTVEWVWVNLEEGPKQRRRLDQLLSIWHSDMLHTRTCKVLIWPTAVHMIQWHAAHPDMSSTAKHRPWSPSSHLQCAPRLRFWPTPDPVCWILVHMKGKPLPAVSGNSRRSESDPRGPAMPCFPVIACPFTGCRYANMRSGLQMNGIRNAIVTTNFLL